jgi:pimeloyl-ACP methyl ester carboxylesterase
MQNLSGLAILMLAILIGYIFYRDIRNEDDTQMQSLFSNDLKKWHERGSYFTYKDKHQIFYVRHDYLNEEKNAIGSSSRPILLLMHGFPSSSYDYIKIWNQLIDKNEFDFAVLNHTLPGGVVAFDYLGYGFSDKPQDYEYSIFDMADIVDRLLLHLKIENVILVAHDVSDTVAQELLRRDNLKNQNHFKINKVILMNGGIFTSIYKPVLMQHILRNRLLKDVSARHFFKYFLFKHSFSRIFGSLNPPSDAELFDFYMNIKYKRGNQILPLTIEYMNERDQYGDVWIDALNETVLDVHFIFGPADPINPRDKFISKLRSDLPNVKLSMLSEMVGHYPQFEDPFTVFQLIKSLITSNYSS